MTGHELCAVYLAIKLHFTQEKYDFFMGSGKAKISVDAFQKRKDKYMFHKLARKLKDEDVVPFLVSNFLHNGDSWTRTLLSEEADNAYIEWKTKIESLSYMFENDIIKIFGDGGGEEKFACVDGGYPPILEMYMHDEITLETLVMLNIMTNCVNGWKKSISDTVIFPKLALKVKKYQPFFSVDLANMKRIVKKHLTKQ